MHAILILANSVQRRRRQRVGGFTLIELMTVLVIAAILIAVGTPTLSEFVADQRVRTSTSDIVADFAFARAKAVERSRRIIVRRTNATWKEGWTIYDDINNNGKIDAGEELKIFDGFPPGGMYLCSDVADFATTVIFRPDGRVLRATAAAAANGIYVVDKLGQALPSKYKVRAILFGTSGRATVEKQNGNTPPC